MDLIINIGLILFLVYLPLMVSFFIFYLPRKYPGFSFKTHWVSSLGESTSPVRNYFEISFRILSVLTIFFAISFFKSFPVNSQTLLMTFNFIFGAVLLFFITLFPLDKETRRHSFFAVLLMVFIILSQIISLTYVFVDLLPVIFFPLGLLVVFLSTLFLVCMRILYKLDFQENMVEMRKKDINFWLKNNTVWEWSLLLLFSIWGLGIAILLI